MKNAGNFLKILRKKYKITGAQLSELLGCSTQFIYAIENGKKRFPFQKLEMIKKIINETDYLELLELLENDEDTKILKDERLKIQSIEEIKQKKIPFYPDIQASAGYGCFNDCEALEYLEVPEDLAKTGNIAIRVLGDSMEPEIKDGDIIIIDTRNIDCIFNKIIVVNYQGAVYLKKFVVDKNDAYLKSINPYYPKIKITDQRELRIIGKLKSVMRYY